MTSGLTASFTGSGTSVAPDHVRLRPGSGSGDRVTVEVAIGGQTTSTDLYYFAFDLVLGDSSVAEYVSGTAVFGDALTLSGSQTGSAQGAQNGNRVVVGVTKLGGGSGNGVTATEAIVVCLTFRVKKAGTTTLAIAGSTSPQNPTGDPAAVDSHGGVVQTVHFDTASAVISAQ
ncbi:MAG: hypothetical protein LAO51_10230 [Acidobacteriia bacterium]|nr:hypothetical protein [Terriglobia bacterium]